MNPVQTVKVIERLVERSKTDGDLRRALDRLPVVDLITLVRAVHYSGEGDRP